jgi:hypothetical protein
MNLDTDSPNLELDPRLGLDALLKGVFDQLHLSNEIGVLN